MKLTANYCWLQIVFWLCLLLDYWQTIGILGGIYPRLQETNPLISSPGSATIIFLIAGVLEIAGFLLFERGLRKIWVFMWIVQRIYVVWCNYSLM